MTTKNQSTGDTIQVPAGEPVPQQDAVVNTGDGFITGVQPASTPEQLRQQQAAAQQPSQPQTNDQRLFTEDEVERFRQQEKEKLYGRIEEMSKTVEELKSAREEERAKFEAEQQRIEEEARAKAREDMDVRELLNQQAQEFQQQIEEMHRQTELANAALQKEREMQELMAYRDSLVSQHRNDIMPEMLDLVRGDSREEIEASVQDVVRRTQSVLQSIQQAQQTQWQGMTGPRVTQPSMGPLEEQQEQRQLTAQDIKNMPMSEYMKHRGTLHQAASSQFRGQ